MAVTPDQPVDVLARFEPARQVRAFEAVMGQIRVLLSEGLFRRGDKLPAERDLAARLGISRNTVREALRMLEISGVIELRRGPKGGAYILDPQGDKAIGPLGRSLRFTDVSVADVTQAMRALTMMLLDAAIPDINEASIARLEANIADAARTGDPAARSAKIICFYELLAAATGNRILMELASSLSEILLAWVLRLGSLGSDRVLDSRRRIVACLRTRDSEGAKAELDRYLSELHDKWLEGDRS